MGLPDFGRAVKFGCFLVPNATDALLPTAQRVERLGLDYVAVQDHPYHRRFVDTWTLIEAYGGPRRAPAAAPARTVSAVPDAIGSPP